MLLLIPPAAMALTGIGVASAAGGGVQLQAQQCDPVIVLAEFFDSVTPPALPPGWSSTTWVTSDSGVPSPPADTVPNAAFVDDPATINDKRLLSPTPPITGGSMRVYFRNNFDFQDGFDGGMLEVSFDNGLTFRRSYHWRHVYRWWLQWKR
jgi:hypothetical protein